MGISICTILFNVLSRIDFTPKTVTKYVSGGTKVVEKVVEVPVEVEKIVEKIVEVPVEVEKIVEVPVPQGCDEEKGNHFFELNEIGLYECVCGKYKAPAGTREIYKAADPYDFMVEGLDEQKLVSDVYFDPAYGIVMTEDGELNVACNAKLYEMIEGELVPIGFLELFDKYRFDFNKGTPLCSVYINIEELEDGTGVIDGLVVVGK